MAPKFMFFEQKWLKAPNTHSKNWKKLQFWGKDHGLGEFQAQAKYPRGYVK